MKIKIITTAGGQSFESTQDVPESDEAYIAHNAIVQAVSTALNVAQQAKLPLEGLVITVS